METREELEFCQKCGSILGYKQDIKDTDTKEELGFISFKSFEILYISSKSLVEFHSLINKHLEQIKKI